MAAAAAAAAKEEESVAVAGYASWRTLPFIFSGCLVCLPLLLAAN